MDCVTEFDNMKTHNENYVLIFCKHNSKVTCNLYNFGFLFLIPVQGKRMLNF